MFDKIEVMQMATELSSHSARRQSIVAQNIANADTPGYRARDIAAFEFSKYMGSASALRRTRPGHITVAGGPESAMSAKAIDAEVSPNGNSVSLEMEMVRSAEARSSHDRALAIYSSSLKILRTSLGRG